MTLTKKERGKLRYDRRQARVADVRARARRTRPSDIAPRRIGDGMPGVQAPQVFHRVSKKPSLLELLIQRLTSQFPPRKED